MADEEFEVVNNKVKVRFRGLPVLPAGIYELRGLEGLYAENNKITVLQPTIGQMLSLKKLYVGGNQLTTLPKEIGDLPNLEILWEEKEELRKQRLANGGMMGGELAQIERERHVTNSAGEQSSGDPDTGLAAGLGQAVMMRHRISKDSRDSQAELAVC